jgi:ABC-type phosphate transport system auxiliary subunit
MNVKKEEINRSDLINLRYIQENRIKELENENKTFSSDKQKLEIELRVTQERFGELKKKEEAESQENKFIRLKHNEEISNIEQKFEKMSKQIEQLTYDNNNLRLNEEKIRIENMSNEKQKENYREKYQDYKNRYKIMNAKLADLEAEFRNFLFMKEHETKEKMRDQENKRQKNDSKQSILHDFQSKINNYKSQIIMNRGKREEN